MAMKAKYSSKALFCSQSTWFQSGRDSNSNPGLPENRYLFDQDATAKAHNAEGYFKTGDIARRDGPHYFILGRASVDSTYTIRVDKCSRG